MFYLIYYYLFALQGYRTGYVYRQPVVRVERLRKGFDDVEVPPAASSFRYIFEDEDGTKYE